MAVRASANTTITCPLRCCSDSTCGRHVALHADQLLTMVAAPESDRVPMIWPMTGVIGVKVAMTRTDTRDPEFGLEQV